MSYENCAVFKLMVEQTVTDSTLPIGTVRKCIDCAGAAVLRQSLVKDSPTSSHGNPDGSLREDACPYFQQMITDVEFGDIVVGEALREDPDNLA